MIYSLLAVVITIMIVQATLGSKIRSNKFLGLGTYCFFVGIVLFVLSRFFGITIISLKYGIKPETMNGEAGEFASLFAAGLGLLMIVSVYLYRYLNK